MARDALQLRLPEVVLASVAMRADGKIFYGVLCALADKTRLVETTYNAAAHAAWTTERSVSRWLDRFVEQDLVDAYEYREGLVLLRITPPAASWTQLSIPHSVLAWPNLSAEAQLAYALLRHRGGRDRRQWVTNSELGLRLGRDSSNASAAGRRSLKALAARGLLKVLAKRAAPLGETEIEVLDADRAWQRHVEAIRRAWRKKSA